MCDPSWISNKVLLIYRLKFIYHTCKYRHKALSSYNWVVESVVSLSSLKNGKKRTLRSWMEWSPLATIQQISFSRELSSRMSNLDTSMRKVADKNYYFLKARMQRTAMISDKTTLTFLFSKALTKGCDVWVLALLQMPLLRAEQWKAQSADIWGHPQPAQNRIISSIWLY